MDITVQTDRLPRPFSFCTVEGVVLFTILRDGSLERGPAFTTNDEMALKFWEVVENLRRPSHA